MALLEAIGRGDPAEIFRRAVEKDMRELIARTRRLRADLALAPEVAGPIFADTLDSARERMAAASVGPAKPYDRSG